MERLSLEDFEKLAARVLDELPDALVAELDNVAFCVEDAPDEDRLGLYEGISRPERDESYSGVLPDKITLYRNVIVDCAGCEEEALLEEIRRTLLHEIAHHLGWDDDHLEEREAELGWR